MYGRPSLPNGLDSVGRYVDSWLRYGCWCQLRRDNDVRMGKINSFKTDLFNSFKGRGTPVDARDEACQRWHQCHACTKIEDPTCNQRQMYGFWQQKALDGNNNYIPESFDVFCNSSSNKTPCMKNRCECDKELAKTLFQLSGFTSDASYRSPLLPQYRTLDSARNECYLES